MNREACAAAGAPTWRHRWHLVAGMAWPWLVAVVLMICFIWGNSLVPGEGSSELSQSALAIFQSVLGDVGLPSAWLTEHVVRKTAHFTEYMVLALLAMQAFRPHRRDRAEDCGRAARGAGARPAGAHFAEAARRGDGGAAGGLSAWTRSRVVRAVACALLLVAVPSIDETIQRFTPDRGPAVTDVLLDCCGAATGVALTVLVSRLARRRSGTR